MSSTTLGETSAAESLPEKHLPESDQSLPPTPTSLEKTSAVESLPQKHLSESSSPEQDLQLPPTLINVYWNAPPVAPRKVGRLPEAGLSPTTNSPSAAHSYADVVSGKHLRSVTKNPTVALVTKNPTVVLEEPSKFDFTPRHPIEVTHIPADSFVPIPLNPLAPEFTSTSEPIMILSRAAGQEPGTCECDTLYPSKTIGRHMVLWFDLTGENSPRFVRGAVW